MEVKMDINKMRFEMCYREYKKIFTLTEGSEIIEIMQ